MNRKTAFISSVARLSFIGLLIVAALNYQTIMDAYALATYKPTTDVSAIERRLELTQYARGLLYRSDPAIATKSAFNTDCETIKGELELGCFYRGHIFVLKIDNASLAPEMDVVTAHELLHAAWARMSDGNRKTLGNQLEAVFRAQTDADLKDRMAQYAKSEPGQEANELHSILATELRTLPPALEQYYAKFFDNRSAIVGAHERYQNVFDSRKQELESQLASIRTLKAQLAAINRQLDAYRGTGNITGYNALVPRQNVLVDTINSRIDLYQAGVDEYNALSKSLDSQVITDTESGVNASH